MLNACNILTGAAASFAPAAYAAQMLPALARSVAPSNIVATAIAAVRRCDEWGISPNSTMPTTACRMMFVCVSGNPRATPRNSDACTEPTLAIAQASPLIMPGKEHTRIASPKPLSDLLFFLHIASCARKTMPKHKTCPKPKASMYWNVVPWDAAAEDLEKSLKGTINVPSARPPAKANRTPEMSVMGTRPLEAVNSCCP